MRNGDAGVEGWQSVRGEGAGGEQEGDEVDVAGSTFCRRNVEGEMTDDLL